MHGNLHVLLFCKEGKVIWTNSAIEEFSREEIAGRVIWELSSDKKSNDTVFRQWSEMIRDDRCEDVFLWKGKEKEHVLHVFVEKLKGLECKVTAICMAYELDVRLLDLTDREREILSMIGNGHGSGAIAKELELSSNTVQAHIKNIKDRVGTRSTLALAGLAALNYSLLDGHDFHKN